MPRHNGARRGGASPLAIQHPAWTCIGCGKGVSASRLCCPPCWGKLSPGLRASLRVPGVRNPHLEADEALTAIVGAATAYLERGRELSAAAQVREAGR